MFRSRLITKLPSNFEGNKEVNVFINLTLHHFYVKITTISYKLIILSTSDTTNYTGSKRKFFFSVN